MKKKKLQAGEPVTILAHDLFTIQLMEYYVKITINFNLECYLIKKELNIYSFVISNSIKKEKVILLI